MSRASTTETDRRAYLVEAGHNFLRVPSDRVGFELFSDVPSRVMVPDRERGREAAPEEIYAALAPLTGDAKLALATKGRAAEIALVDALELDGPPVVVTHGLFSTTQAALARRAAVLEDLALGAPGTSDVDLDALDARLAKGGVNLVYLEVANNAVFGWPLAAATVARARAACDRHGAKLVLDAARPLANAAALGEDLVGTAREILGHAHAFTISCAKEFLVPIGSVVGSTDAALIGKARMALFKAGTSMSLIDPPQHRADLRDGARYSLDHPALIRDRLALVRRVAAALVERGVEVVQPVTAHAVYLPLAPALLPAGDIAAMLGLLAHLYAIANVRAQVTGTKRGPALRLAFPLDTPLDDTELAALVTGVAAFIGRLDERPHLHMAPGQFDVPYFHTLVTS